VRGITAFTAQTLFENRDMMSVFRHAGFPITTSFSGGEISVRLSIEPIDDHGVPLDVHPAETN
jgi:hypothetical protein